LPKAEISWSSALLGNQARPEDSILSFFRILYSQDWMQARGSIRGSQAPP